MLLTSIVKLSVGISLCIVFLSANFVEPNIVAGVKAGDWIEYTVSTSGTPPKEFEVVWARMQIISVEDTKISVNVTTMATNGTLSSLTMTLNLTEGQVGAWFIIPAGLNPGKTFWDKSLGRNVIVESEKSLTFAGAIRVITKATTSQRLKLWDKDTGVFVECVDVLDNYSINATAIGTNMWGTQKIEQQQTLLYTTLFIVTAVAVCASIVLGFKKQKEM